MQSLPLENESFITLEKEFKVWLNALGYAPSTAKSAPLHIRELLFFLEQHGIKNIKEVSKEDIKSFFAYLSGRVNQNTGGSLSTCYLAKYRQSIRNFDRFLKATCEWGFDLPKGQIKVEQQIKDVLSQSEIKKMYAACEDDYLGQRDKAMLSLFYGCGLRRSEGLGLDLEDIHWEKHLIHVRKGKNYKERYVPFNEQIKEDLKIYLAESRALITSESPYRLKEYSHALLLSIRGVRISDCSLTVRIRKLKSLAGDKNLMNKKVSLHTLRHSVATHLLENGMKLKQVALFLGHASLESTQIYTHLTDKG